MKALLLIDANSLIHRAFHALPPFTSPAGKPTGALYGVSSMLLRILREEAPDYAAACFDRPEPTFREKKYEAYKAQRPPAPDALVSQIIEARALFRAFGVAVFEAAGFEADDLIATLAEKFSGERDMKIVILTGDLDSLQLIRDGKIVVRATKKGISDVRVYDEDVVLARYGLPPDRLPDYKALVGDPSDNVKGVPGIGPKTAAALLRKFGDLEKILAAAQSGEIAAKKLGGFADAARLSLELVTLRRDATLGEAALDDLRIRRNDESLAGYLGGLGFESLVKRLEKKNAPAASPQAKRARRPAGLF